MAAREGVSAWLTGRDPTPASGGLPGSNPERPYFKGASFERLNVVGLSRPRAIEEQPSTRRLCAAPPPFFQMPVFSGIRRSASTR